MPTTPSPSAAPATAALRASVLVVLFLTGAAVVLQLMAVKAAMNPADGISPGPALFVPAVLTLMAGVGLAAVVEGVARVVRRTGAVTVDDDAAAPAVNRLAAAVAELRTALPDMLAELRPPLATALLDPAPERDEGDVPQDPDAPPGSIAPDPAVLRLERVIQLLEELKELALLDDAQRQARGQMSKDRRKTERVEEAAVLIRRREWEQADALLTLLESLHPGDPEVLARRNELDDVRGAAREAAWVQVVRHVEDLMALSRFDDAAAAVAAFRESHPTHAAAAALAAQVVADRDAQVERTAAAMFSEIKTAVDARQWRMALEGAQRFLGRFPDHARSDRIRQQVRTIQKNAEIEERHEQEDRIKELAKSGRFAESADLCVDLLARFPDSPQAPSLRNLLPRLRERSAMAEAAVE